MAVTMNYGAAPTYVKIASQTSGAVSSVTFSNIPQGYTDLVLVCNAANNTGVGYLVQLQFNGDTTTKYSQTRLNADGGSGSSLRESSGTEAWLAWTTSVFSTIKIDILNYSNTTTNKTSISRWGAAAYRMGSWVALWRSTAAITSIKILSESPSVFTSGSTFTIYGIKAALVPKASGGDVIVQDGSYWYHAFRSTGVFNPKQSLSCDVLVIAGGGGGGYAISGQSTAGGAGAGGLRYFAAESVTTATSVTVGAGGAGAVSGGAIAAGAAGGNSVFASYTSAGGAGGFSADNGGSGSGQRNNAGAGGLGNTPATSPSQGNNGGASTGGVAGGGGGAGAAGGTPDGGIGVNTYSTWATATGTGVSGYYAGGGGGHTTGIGGTGGGANGSTGSSAHAIANTGGGGGASQVSPSGNGGSGLVIVRYPI